MPWNKTIDWETAIKERDKLMSIHISDKAHHNKTFIEYLRAVWIHSVVVRNATIYRMIIDHYELFETLPDEEKVTVTLMGW